MDNLRFCFIVRFVLISSYLIQNCYCDCDSLRQIQTYFSAKNRVLLSRVFQWKTVSSAVVCGRDCSMDPQCASFNYQENSGICQLSNATRDRMNADFVELQGSSYYDFSLDTPSLSISIKKYSSCKSWYDGGQHENGIYTIYPTGWSAGIKVYCDMETDGGGWIVFQRRQDASVDFYRNWTEYQSGFGDLLGEFWLGNNKLRALTDNGQWQLLIEMEDWDDVNVWASYGEFAVSGDQYTLRIGSYDRESTVEDSMLYHDGYPFTTKDRDNDNKDYNCAVEREGAWWFESCFQAHLNGKFYGSSQVEYAQGIQWKDFRGYEYSLEKCSMKIKANP